MFAAIEQGTANGTLTQISIDYGSQRIAAFDILPESLTFTSGNQSLELTGGFPTTLSQLINLVDIFDGEAEGSLSQYGFTGFTLRDGGEVLVSLQTGETLHLSIEGYTLTLTGADFSRTEIFDFIVFGTDQNDSTLRNLPGFSFDSLVITAPGGVEVLRAENVGSFGDFLDALDRLLAPFGLPSLADLELAFATGDPHLLTLDGLGYDFHAAGEYVLVRAANTDLNNNEPIFEVQARMLPAGENVTANTAVAVQLDGGRVMVNAQGSSPVTLNGIALTVTDQSMVEVGGDRIYRDGNTYMLIHTADGFMETGYSAVVVTLVGTRVDIGVALDASWMGHVEGLLGNFNGDSSDDLVLADGTPLTREPGLVFGDDPENNIWGVYGQFREDWRVTDDSTLFSYRAGEGPDSFYLPDYPTRMITLDDFSPEERAVAEAQALGAGLTPGTFAFNNAVLDLLLTGDDSYLESAIVVNDAVVAREQSVDAPLVTGGGLEGLLTLSGQLSTTGGDALTGATVTFRPEGRSVSLTRLTRDSNEFGFELREGATGQLDATRAYDKNIDPGITALDALDVLRLAVGLAPSFGAAKAQNFIAADINGDGKVTALDALEVLRAAVGLTSDNAPRWVFFDADTDFDAMSLSRENAAVPTGIDISAFGLGAPEFNMQGILLGNMELV